MEHGGVDGPTIWDSEELANESKANEREIAQYAMTCEMHQSININFSNYV